jgi:hypothetical protein
MATPPLRPSTTGLDWLFRESMLDSSKELAADSGQDIRSAAVCENPAGSSMVTLTVDSWLLWSWSADSIVTDSATPLALSMLDSSCEK